MNKRRLVELCDVIVPMRDKPKEFVTEENGIPWCRIEDIEGKFLNGSKSEKYVSKECIERMNLKVFPVGTVLCAVTGASIGTYAITTRELITNQTFAGLVCKENLLYNEFLYYYIKMHTSTFINNSVGCAQAYITRETLENFLIPDLEYDEQVRLVKVLKHLDDKIKINNESNVELELMTRTIYDYWFLQFDFPDENGKLYKSSGGKMVWNEELKKEIPDGWRIGTLNQYIDRDKGGDWGKEKEEGNYIRKVSCLRGADFPSITGTATLTAPKRFILEKNIDKFLESGDLIIEISGGSPTQSTGRICYINDSLLERFDIDVITSNFCKAISLKNIAYMYWFYVQWKKIYESNILFKYEGKTTGIKNLLFDIFIKDYKFVQPPDELIFKYNEKVADIYEKIQKNQKESQELASLRDFLLPLLMNGQVGFKEC